MQARAYYNEIDETAAHVLRALIAENVIAPGDVDTRSIVDVQPDDLKGYTQVHFFAGSGGWSLAARHAGIADDERLWTGSCPCQPFSSAGQRRGVADDRHLWPQMFRLLRSVKPPFVVGEQVSGAPGRAWWDQVAADLEGDDYACGACDVSAIAAGGSQVRQRVWFVARLNGVAPIRLTEPRRQLFSWSAEPAMGSVAHGVSRRMDLLRLLGNALDVRLAAEVIGVLIDIDRERT